MASAQTEIAEAVKAQLEAATLLLTFDVERSYAPSLDTTTLEDVKVFVGSTAERVDLFGENATRGECEHDYTIQLGIFAKADASDVSALDDLSEFREQVIDLFKVNRRLTALPAASLVEVGNPQAYDPAKLQSHGRFEAFINLTYRLMR